MCVSYTGLSLEDIGGSGDGNRREGGEGGVGEVRGGEVGEGGRGEGG